MKYRLFASIYIVVTLAFSSPILAATPALTSDAEVSTAGYYRLSWKKDAEGHPVSGDFILEEANDAAFSRTKPLYSGPDTAALVSGRPNGTYYYRIRNVADTDQEAWSNVTRVEVAHHPLSRAFMFFALGAMVFLATLIVVITGSKKHNQ